MSWKERIKSAGLLAVVIEITVLIIAFFVGVEGVGVREVLVEFLQFWFGGIILFTIYDSFFKKKKKEGGVAPS